MTGKIAAAIVAAIVLATASAGAASAQTRTRAAGAWQAPAYDTYYNNDYWNAIASPARAPQHDPFAGTVFDGVVPY